MASTKPVYLNIRICLKEAKYKYKALLTLIKKSVGTNNRSCNRKSAKVLVLLAREICKRLSKVAYRKVLSSLTPLSLYGSYTTAKKNSGK